MSKRFLFAILIITACSFAWAAAGELVQTVTFNRNDLKIVPAGDYDVVDLQGCPAGSPDGQPRLPRLMQSLSIPAGASLDGVEIISQDVMELPGTYHVVPAQRDIPLPMPGKNFKSGAPKPDAAVYGRDAEYPATVIRSAGTGSMCGYRIGSVELRPVRYNPVTKKLSMATRITYRLKYREMAVDAAIPSAYQREVFGDAARAMVANPISVSRNAPPVQRNLSPKALPAGEYRYVTISGAAMFDTVLQRLAAWKTKKGMRDTVIDISWIYASYTGYDNAQKVRNFINEATSTWGTVYVLLAGQGDDRNSGQNLIPCRHAYYTSSGGGSYADEDSIPTDLYYSDLDGTWDGNGNHVWGEQADGVNMYADVYVGRAPILTVAQAQNFVAKTLKYEQSPPAGYIKKMLLPAAILWSSYEERPMQRAIARMTPAGWTDDSLFERNGTLSEAAMVASMNNGRGLGNWIGHGNETGIYMGGVYYSSSDAQAASNGDKQGAHISIACFTGAMDEVSGGDCMAEHIINRVGGGAVGVMMNTRYGWGALDGSSNYVPGPSDRLDTTFCNNILATSSYRQGQALAAAKNSWVPYADSSVQYDMTRWCIYELTLFGDPELPLWTDEPAALQVAHNPTVPFGPSNLVVTVNDNATGSPISGALVCAMFRDKTVYSYGTTDGTGQVSLAVNPSRVDSLLVTVTARNHTPYEGYALVQSSGPYVSYLKHTLSDAGGNGQANPGELVRLPTWVKNYGSQVSDGAVTGTFRTTSPWVTLTPDSAYIYGTMAAGDSARYEAGFGFTVSPSCSNGTVISFELECRDASHSWLSSLAVTVYAPKLFYNSHNVIDPGPGGNDNGIMEPGETDSVRVTLGNSGGQAASGTSAVLSSSDPYLTITGTTASYGDLAGGGSGMSVPSYVVTAGTPPADPYFAWVRLGISANAGGYGAADSFRVTIGNPGFSDNVEDAGITGRYSVQSQWHVSTRSCSSATHSWWCGDEGTGVYANSASAALTTPDFVIGPNTKLTFWHKYNLETGYDYGYAEYSSDGGSSWTALSTFNGTQASWTKQSYDLSALSAGTHLQVRFRFTSDGSVTREGWLIDDIAVGTPPLAEVSGGQVSPATGDTGTVYSYQVTYESATGIAPSESTVVVDGTPHNLAYVSGTYATGAVYRYSSKQAWGSHNYRFLFGAGGKAYKVPGDGHTISGPLVGNLVFGDDFEGGLGKWTRGHSGGTQDWDTTSAKYHGSTHSVTDSRVGNYANSVSSYLRMSAGVNLSSSDTTHPPVLTWWERYDTESGWDYCRPEVSTNGGGTWDTLYPPYAGVDTLVWKQRTVSLKKYCGLKAADVRIQFRLTSDGSVVRDGWYIDDVKIVDFGGMLGVELSALTAAGAEGGNQVRWRTESETSCERWIVERSCDLGFGYVEIGQIAGQGNSSAPHEYVYLDAKVSEGQEYYYRLTEVDLGGQRTSFGPVSVRGGRALPAVYQLGQNYPNPATGRTVIKYQLPRAGETSLKLYNIMGQEVRTLVGGLQKAGYYQAAWDGRDNAGRGVSNGVYLYKMISGGFRATRKLMIVK